MINVTAPENLQMDKVRIFNGKLIFFFNTHTLKYSEFTYLLSAFI